MGYAPLPHADTQTVHHIYSSRTLPLITKRPTARLYSGAESKVAGAALGRGSRFPDGGENENPLRQDFGTC